MSARDVINAACIKIEQNPRTYASAVIEALTADGYTIIRDDENHKATVERCIAAVMGTFIGDSLAPKFRIAQSLRSLIKEDGDAK